MEFIFFLFVVVPIGLASTAAYFIYKGMRKRLNLHGLPYSKTVSGIVSGGGFLAVLIGVFFLIAYNIRIER